MNRETLELLIQEFYNMGKESAETPRVDMEALKAEISAIKGIGETRRDEILKSHSEAFMPIREHSRIIDTKKELAAFFYLHKWRKGGAII
mgnify:CR=1 FL=1